MHIKVAIATLYVAIEVVAAVASYIRHMQGRPCLNF